MASIEMKEREKVFTDFLRRILDKDHLGFSREGAVFEDEIALSARSDDSRAHDVCAGSRSGNIPGCYRPNACLQNMQR